MAEEREFYEEEDDDETPDFYDGGNYVGKQPDEMSAIRSSN